MVHHTEWDREQDKRHGLMQSDHDEMEQIIKEMGPGGKHYHAFKDGSVKSDSQIMAKGASGTVVHRGKDYDHSLPSLYHGKWHKPSNASLSMMSFVRLLLLIACGFFAIKLITMAAKSMTVKRPRSRSRSRSKR